MNNNSNGDTFPQNSNVRREAQNILERIRAKTAENKIGLPWRDKFEETERYKLYDELSHTFDDYREMSDEMSAVIDLIEAQPIDGKFFELDEASQLAAIDADYGFIAHIKNITDEAIIEAYRIWGDGVDNIIDLACCSLSVKVASNLYAPTYGAPNDPFLRLANIYHLLYRLADWASPTSKIPDLESIDFILSKWDIEYETGRLRYDGPLPDSENDYEDFRLECGYYLTAIFNYIYELGDDILLNKLKAFVGGSWQACRFETEMSGTEEKAFLIMCSLFKQQPAGAEGNSVVGEV